MTKPKCPHCNHRMCRTIGVKFRATAIYYLNRESLGYTVPDSAGGWWKGPTRWNRGKVLHSFYCKNCGKSFPDEMTKGILKYLRQDIVLKRLKN